LLGIDFNLKLNITTIQNLHKQRLQACSQPASLLGRSGRDKARTRKREVALQ